MDASINGQEPPADIRHTFALDPERYERARPSYPSELFDALFAVLPTRPDVLEVGPGTGQATRHLIQRGAAVTAVELGQQFVSHLRAAHIDADVVHGEFETAPLPAKSFDAVVAATAYHWVRPEQQIARPHDLLRPGGHLGIIDLIQVGSPVDGGYFDRVQPIYAAFGNDRHNWRPPTYTDAEPPMEARLSTDARFSDVVVHRVRWDQAYTTAEYRDLLMTYSATLHMPVGPRDELVGQLTAVIDDEFDGRIVRPLVATLTLATAR